MSDLVYISRNFTELGPFSTQEVLDFYTRRILTGTDFVRFDGAEVWMTLADWLAGASPDTASSSEPVPESKGGKPKPASKPKVAKAKK